MYCDDWAEYEAKQELVKTQNFNKADKLWHMPMLVGTGVYGISQSKLDKILQSMPECERLPKNR